MCVYRLLYVCVNISAFILLVTVMPSRSNILVILKEPQPRYSDDNKSEIPYLILAIPVEVGEQREDV